jgi:acetyl-CoA carboxylase carboxyltransferase component
MEVEKRERKHRTSSQGEKMRAEKKRDEKKKVTKREKIKNKVKRVEFTPRRSRTMADILR